MTAGDCVVVSLVDENNTRRPSKQDLSGPRIALLRHQLREMFLLCDADRGARHGGASTLIIITCRNLCRSDIFILLYEEERMCEYVALMCKYMLVHIWKCVGILSAFAFI